MRIHDPAADDIIIQTPENWPDINLSGFQSAFSLEDRTSAENMENKLKMAVAEVVGNFDPEQVVLPWWIRRLFFSRKRSITWRFRS